MTIKEVLKKASHRLRMSKIDHSNAEAELLLAHTLNKPREFLITHPEKDVSKTHAQKFEKLLERRRTHEPIAYLLGYKEFYGRAFSVNEDVLIPRPETETLIEVALEAVRSLNAHNKDIVILDIGTGSGCVALTLVAELPNARAVGVDVSSRALDVARQNAQRLELDYRTTFKLLNIASPDAKAPQLPPYHMLILTANLPYLPDFTWETRTPDIKEHEPIHALVSGADGLNHYRALLRRLRAWGLTPNILLFEADPPQFAPLAKLTHGTFKTHHISIHKDLRGLDRILLAVQRETEEAISK